MIFLFFKRILKIYYYAVGSFILPLVMLFIFLVDRNTVNISKHIFLNGFLYSFFPLGIIGIILTSIGLFKSIQKKESLNSIIGTLGIIGGCGLIIVEFLGLTFIAIITRN